MEACLVEIIGRFVLWAVISVVLLPVFYITTTPFILALALVRDGSYRSNVQQSYGHVFRCWQVVVLHLTF